MKEIAYLGRVIEAPSKPFVAVLGGAKISGKIDVIAHLMEKVDHILIGGGMAYTFFKAMGYAIGTSLLEEDRIDMARDLLEKAHGKLLLPIDNLITDHIDIKQGTIGSLQTTPVDAIPEGWCGGGHRAPDPATVRGCFAHRPHRGVEWADGNFRTGGIGRRNIRY